MTWRIEFLDEAEKDMKKLDHSVQIQVLKGIRKVGQNPLSAEEGGINIIYRFFPVEFNTLYRNQSHSF